MITLFTSLKDAAAWSAAARQEGKRIGFVPTMGALHEGHCSLIERAASENDVVVVSIFVNPLQFGDPNDLARYPRSLEADCDLAERSGATMVVAPEVAELYPTWPNDPETTVSVGRLGTLFEGASRPGHFNGVATIVTMLHQAIRPTHAYYGEKDFQQLTILRQVAADLWSGVEIEGCPIIREDDGLAMSSRNVRLSSEARVAARVLSTSLVAAALAVTENPELAGSDLEALVHDVLRSGGELVEPDYAVVVDASTLERWNGRLVLGQVRLLVAAVVGGVRLLDNADLMPLPSSTK